MCTWWGPVLLSWCDPLAHNPRLSFHPVYHYRTPQILQIPTLDLIFMLISVLNSADLILLPKDIKKTLNLVLFWRGLQWSQKRTALVFLCRTQINKWWEFLKKKKTNRMSLSEKAVVVVRLQPIMATSTSYRQFFVVIMHAFKVIDFYFLFFCFSSGRT